MHLDDIPDSGYKLVFEATFERENLDTTNWFPFYALGWPFLLKPR
jgi:hypothetical protein